MIYIIISLIIFVISILYCNKERQKVHKINETIDYENEKLLEKNKDLLNKHESYTIQYNNLCKDLDIIQQKINEKDNKYNKLKFEENNIINNIKNLNETVTSVYKDSEKAAKAAYENYCLDLENQKKEAEEGYLSYEEKLKQIYADIQFNLYEETKGIKNELDKIKASRIALIEAQLREKEIKEKSAFYCLQISDEDKSDISKLEVIKKTFSKPRIISMLIWQTYYQKLLKSKTAEILGSTATVTGIYKITNIVTNECYIGQAVDVAVRWSEHAKCGLGIDAPVANKLYKAMLEYGLYNFSWELLEECPQNQLNEKERYYIDLYNSCDYGYNSSKGIKK